MEYGYFPGCSLGSTAKEYDATVRALAERFDIQLQEIEDWNCCGATPAAAVSEEASLALPWRNLAQAEQMGLDAVLSPCPSCHSHMCTSHKAAAQDELAARMRELTEANYTGRLQLRHLLDFVTEEIGVDKLAQAVSKPLVGVRAVCYYGCTTRLHGVSVDDPERPTKMESIVAALGGQALPFSRATDCCGAALVLTKSESFLRMSNDLLAAAKLTGANCVVVACPVCQTNLDMRQRSIEKKAGADYDLPILYLSQLIMMALGWDYKQLGFNKHFIEPEALYQEATTPPEKSPKKKKKKKKNRIAF